MAEDRLDALRQRVKHKPSTRPERRKNHDRSRHTLYLDNSLVKLIDQAFKDTAHELYPLEVDKADYLEACLKFALAHTDKVKVMVESALSDA